MNLLLIMAVIIMTAYVILKSVQKKQNAEVDEKIEVDEKTYNLDKMTEFVKKRLDEIIERKLEYYKELKKKIQEYKKMVQK